MVEQQPAPPSTSGPINPVPLSLPSILVNAKPRGTPTSKASRPPLSSSSSAPPHAKVARQPGKRKLLRLENARFSTAINPHIVRPRPSDYSPGYESRRYKGSFQQPIPGLVRELGRGEEVPRDGREVRDWRREMDEVKRIKRAAAAPDGRRGEKAPGSPTTAALSDHPPPSGLFTMSLPEARFFLKRRAVVETRLDSGQASSTPSSTSSSPAMQSLVDLVEDDFASWKEQVVYLLDAEATSNQADTTRLNPRPRLVVPSSSSLAQPRVEEHHHLPHSLSYLVPDSFDRLTVHCLARLWGLKSLSKSINHNGEELKLTWIFKPPPSSRRAQANLVQPSRGGARANGARGHLNPLIRHLARSEPAPPSTRTSRLSGIATSHGLDTPPATDISSQSEFEEGEGTDVDTIESASVASLPSSGADSGSELGGLSDVGEAEEEDQGEDVGEETLRPPDADADTDALIVPVRRRLEELALCVGEGEDVEDADEIESLPSSRGEREYEAEAEDDGEWQEIEDHHLE